MLCAILIYVFVKYNDFTVKKIASSDLSSILSSESEIFSKGMVTLVVLILIVIIIERYASRSDTKQIIEKR